MKAIFPGSFDPVTFGHLDLIARASDLFDGVIIGVGINSSKTRLLSLERRLEVIRETTAGIEGVQVQSFDGLLVDFCRQRGIGAIVKGLRTASDFDYEIAQAQMNGHLSGIQTVFLPTAPELSFISSRLVKEVASLGGDVSALAPAQSIEAMRAAQS